MVYFIQIKENIKSYLIKRSSEMKIGIPKEIMENERRVSSTPETVSKYIADGHSVVVECGAGEGSYFQDAEYAAAGAKMEKDAAVIYSESDLILKVKEPQFNKAKNIHEVDMMRKGQYLVTFIHPASPVNHKMVQALADKGVIGLTLDGIPRISRAQNMDALTSMSTCAGYKGMIMAADSLTKFVPQIFSAVGMVKPGSVLVIGAGVAGLQAIATAKRLGAAVSAADIRPAAAEQAASLGAKIVDTGIPADIAVGEGGYAKSLSAEWLAKERAALKDAIVNSDIVFLSALVPGKQAPILITEDTVKEMKPGAVIVDVSIDQGGNCDITPAGAVEKKHNITINGIKNIPGHLPTSSTWMFSQNMYNLIKYLVKDNKITLDMNDEICSSIIVTDGNKIVHQGTKEAMGIK